MPFQIVRNDITHMNVDAIVNAANPRPIIGYGVDHGIHQKAGKELLKARKVIGDIPFGNAEITPAFDLNAKYVIHAVSPIWKDGTQNEVTLLSNCYTRSLQLALENNCESIAFPLLSAGNHGFPKDIALQTAVNAISQFLMQHDMDIYLVVFSRNAFALSEKLFHSIQSFIDDNYTHEKFLEEYGVRDKNDVREKELEELRFSMHQRRLYSMAYEDISDCSVDELLPCSPLSSATIDSKGRTLEDLIDEMDETFSEALIRMIDQKGFADPDIYKRANISKQHFNKIKNNKDYKPNKNTAIALAVSLKLNLDETKDFIGKAGYALTHSSKSDIIVEFFINEGKFNVIDLNTALYTFGENTLN
mgnify:CR=1 FL=1